jgi:hypothetical protein
MVTYFPLFYQSASTSDVIPISNSSYDLARAGHPYACVGTFIFKLLALFRFLNPQ